MGSLENSENTNFLIDSGELLLTAEAARCYLTALFIYGEIPRAVSRLAAWFIKYKENRFEDDPTNSCRLDGSRDEYFSGLR